MWSDLFPNFHQWNCRLLRVLAQKFEKLREIGTYFIIYQNCSDLKWENIVLVIEKNLAKGRSR